MITPDWEVLAVDYGEGATPRDCWAVRSADFSKEEDAHVAARTAELVPDMIEALQTVCGLCDVGECDTETEAMVGAAAEAILDKLKEAGALE